MRLALVAACLAATPALADEPTSLGAAFSRLSAEPVRASGTLQFNGNLWLDTDTGDRISLSTALPRAVVERAEACEWPDGCRATVTGILRVHGGALNLLSEEIRFHDTGPSTTR